MYKLGDKLLCLGWDGHHFVEGNVYEVVESTTYKNILGLKNEEGRVVNEAWSTGKWAKKSDHFNVGDKLCWRHKEERLNALNTLKCCVYTVKDTYTAVSDGGFILLGKNTLDYFLVEDPSKLWRDMTPEEKGALLLAHYEGKTIEACYYGDVWFKTNDPAWDNNSFYRVKPEPKRETVTLYNGVENSFDWDLWNKHIDKKHRITFDLIDGEPDCNSIKMEKL